jgi:predicted ATPase with chaperone activity
MEVLPRDAAARERALGELSLDGSLIAVIGALPAAVAAAEADCGLICPAGLRGGGGLGSGAVQVIAPKSLLALVNHFNGRAPIPPARPGAVARRARRDLVDVEGAGEGQARARDRRRRTPPPADGGTAGQRQVDARRPDAGHPAAAGAVGGAGDLR